MSSGFFIVLEGIDFCGKGTQLEIIKAWLKSLGLAVRVHRSPNEDKAIGRLIRRRLTHKINMSMEDLQQLYSEDKLLTYVSHIKPALQRGDIVLGDRWNLSFWAYGSLKLSIDKLTVIYDKTFCSENVEPFLYVFIDISVEESIKRRKAAAEEAQLFEQKEILIRVHQRYQEILRSCSDAGFKLALINGEQSIEKVTDEIKKSITNVLDA